MISAEIELPPQRTTTRAIPIGGYWLAKSEAVLTAGTTQNWRTSSTTVLCCSVVISANIGSDRIVP